MEQLPTIPFHSIQIQIQIQIQIFNKLILILILILIQYVQSKDLPYNTKYPFAELLPREFPH